MTDRAPDGRPLLQAGLLLFLLSLVLGIVVPKLTLPRLGLSAHLLGITQGTFLVAIASLWRRLGFTRVQSVIAQILAIYGCVAAWAANVYGAARGAGGTILSIAAAGVQGTDLQEAAIRAVLRSSAVCLIAFVLMLLWKSFRPGPPAPEESPKDRPL